MVLKGKLIGEVELRSSGDLFHEIFATNFQNISTATPKHVQGCRLHDGEHGKPGSILHWDFTMDGKSCISKSLIESIDEENKTIKYKVVEGDLLEGKNKSLSISIHVTPGVDSGYDLVKWVLEFERLHEDAPFPTNTLDLLLNMSKDIENHHSSGGDA